MSIREMEDEQRKSVKRGRTLKSKDLAQAADSSHRWNQAMVKVSEHDRNPDSNDDSYRAYRSKQK